MTIPTIHQRDDCPFEKIFPSELNRDNHYYMALHTTKQSKLGKKMKSPSELLLNTKGTLLQVLTISRVTNNDPTAHAEILAISQAARYLGDWRLNACTLRYERTLPDVLGGARHCPNQARLLWIGRYGKMGSRVRL